MHKGIPCWICSVYRIVSAIRKHIVAQYALPGGGIGVAIDESAPLGIVVTGLEVVEASFLVIVITTVAQRVGVCQGLVGVGHIGDVARHRTHR